MLSYRGVLVLAVWCQTISGGGESNAFAASAMANEDQGRQWDAAPLS
jgi:hypothetical protein